MNAVTFYLSSEGQSVDLDWMRSSFAVSPSCSGCPRLSVGSYLGRLLCSCTFIDVGQSTCHTSDLNFNNQEIELSHVYFHLN